MLKQVDLCKENIKNTRIKITLEFRVQKNTVKLLKNNIVHLKKKLKKVLVIFVHKKSTNERCKCVFLLTPTTSTGSRGHPKM